MVGPHLPQPASPGTLCDKWFWYTRRVSSKQQDRFTAPPDRGRKTCASLESAAQARRQESAAPTARRGRKARIRATREEGYAKGLVQGGTLRGRKTARMGAPRRWMRRRLLNTSRRGLRRARMLRCLGCLREGQGSQEAQSRGSARSGLLRIEPVRELATAAGAAPLAPPFAISPRISAECLN